MNADDTSFIFTQRGTRIAGRLTDFLGQQPRHRGPKSTDWLGREPLFFPFTLREFCAQGQATRTL